jgi:tRNA A-37 threonylcarbamoyl transferase component Bud32
MRDNENPAGVKPACPTCGLPLPPDSPQGLCPKCLFAGLANSTLSASQTVPQAPPPALNEIAPHFPQLEIIECLGRGGMGVVYKARQKSLDRLVALKLLAPERVNDPQFAERFGREARALAALNHPNIVTIHDFGQAGGFYFLLMEFVDGVNLRQAMKAGRFTPEQALAVVPPVCEALQFAHEHGIVHRDIKPENLLLDKDGRVKIADFGIAKMLNENDTSGVLTESQPAGTPQYMAPEQKAHRAADHRSDIYSLGVVLYEMLTGELPATNLEPPSRRVQIDVRLDEIVLRALEKKPEMRFQTAGEFRTQIETLTETSVAFEAPGGAVPSSLVAFLQSVVGMKLTSAWARKLVNLSALGFLASLGFLGFVPVPGMERCFGFAGFAGFFGLIGVAYVFELMARSVNREQPPESTVPGQPRFSVTAILGAAWVPFFILACLGMFTVQFTASTAEDAGPAWWQYALRFTLLPLGVTAPFGTTVLGWIAVSQIRRSAGKLHGMWLAVFDGLVFPLLALDALLTFLAVQGLTYVHDVRPIPGDSQPGAGVPLVPLVVWLSVIVLVDVLILRAVWRAVNRSELPARGVADNKSKNRRMAVAMGIAAVCLVVWFVLLKISVGGVKEGGLLNMTVMPVKVIGRNVIVRVMTREPSSPCEMRVVLEGPVNSADQMNIGMPVMPTELAESGFRGTFVTPRGSPGNQPWFNLPGPMSVDLAFAFPTPELAQMAFENVQASQPIDVISNITRRHTIMDVVDPNGVHSTALLLVSAPVREGDPKWVSVDCVSHLSSGSSVDMTWEVRTSRQGAVIRRYDHGATEVVLSGERDKRGLFKTTIRIFLYATGPGRVRLEEWTGASHSNVEMDGDFNALAREFRDTAFPGTIKTEREWETELCRIGGKPVTVQVTDELAGARESHAQSVAIESVAAGSRPATRPLIPAPSTTHRTFSLHHMLASDVVDNLRQILSGSEDQKAKASANNREVTVTAPVEVMNRVETFITATDWPDKIDRGSDYNYPRQSIMRAARSFFYACTIEDDAGAFSKMLSPWVLAKLKGDTNSEAFFNYQMGGVPDLEWEKSLRGDWPGKNEVMRRFLREWNRYPLKFIQERGGTAIGFGVKNFCSVSFEGAPKDFYEITIEPARGEQATSQDSFYFSSLPPWWESSQQKGAPGAASPPQ